jgi:hypothetical protein
MTVAQPAVSPADALIRKVEDLRPILDAATGKTGVQIRAILERGTITVTSSVKQFDERGR